MKRDLPHFEALLAARLIDGDKAAFDDLYRRYYEAVYVSAIAVLKDVFDAEDVVHEVFLSLWEKRNALKHADNIAGWLFVAATNKSLNLLRKRLRERLGMKPVDSLPDIPFIEEDVEISDGQLLLLKKAIQALPPKRRKVFELCKLEGKSYDEVALELHISKNTVKTQMADALDFIKNYIVNQTGDGVLLFGIIAILLETSR